MGSSVGVLLTGYSELLTMLLIPADSDLLLEHVLFDSSTVLWACLKIAIDLRGIESTSGFSPGFRFKFASPGRNAGISHEKMYFKQISA